MDKMCWRRLIKTNLQSTLITSLYTTNLPTHGFPEIRLYIIRIIENYGFQKAKGYNYASVLNFQIVITSIRRYECENCLFLNLVSSLTSRQLIYSIQVNKVPSLLLYSLGQSQTKALQSPRLVAHHKSPFTNQFYLSPLVCSSLNNHLKNDMHLYR